MLLGLLAPSEANANRHRFAGGYGHGHGHGHGYARAGWTRHAWRGGHLQCVPFARSDSGIELKGNASIWWNEAAGRYERGAQPEPGSVLSFSANGRMRLGHVAVVSRVVNSREIEIDHANWWGPGSYGGVARGVPVVDVSPNNDWTSVRVALGNGSFGSVYPTHGFIYDRPDRGVMVANATPAAPVAALDPPPADLRPAAARAAAAAPGFQTIGGSISYDEVAEAPAEFDAPHAMHYGRFRFGRSVGGGFARHGGYAQSWHRHIAAGRFAHGVHAAPRTASRFHLPLHASSGNPRRHG